MEEEKRAESFSAAVESIAALKSLLARESGEHDGKDRKHADGNLARALTSGEMAQALQQATLEQIDEILTHEALAVELKPQCTLLLLGTKEGKLNQWKRKLPPTREGKEPFLAACATFVQQISRFFYQVPVYVASKETAKVCALSEAYLATAELLSDPMQCLYPLLSFLRRSYQQGNTAVSPLHAHFFSICLQSKCYFAASPILDLPLMEIQPQLSSVNYLEFGYYGGILLLGQKRFGEAADYFLLAVTAPALAISAIVIEAYKKLVLARLLAFGHKTPVSLPNYASYVVSRNIESHCGAYVELRKAFQALDLLQAVALVQENAQEYQRSNNLGLVKQCVVALQQQKLLQLTQTYVTISMERMAEYAGFASTTYTEKTLLRLIADGKVPASISVLEGGSKMVRFEEEEERFDSSEVLEQLQSQISRIVVLSEQMRQVDADIVTSSKFVAKLKEKEKRKHGGASHGGNDSSPAGAWHDSTAES